MADKAASAYRTISEAGAETGLPAHVLRFWESKFSQVRPVKRAGGRRLYRPHDISIILGLKHLLYEEGFTIKGAQKYVKDHGVGHLVEQMDLGASSLASPQPPAPNLNLPSEESTAPLFDQVSSPRIPSGRLDSAIEKLNEARSILAIVRKSA